MFGTPSFRDPKKMGIHNSRIWNSLSALWEPGSNPRRSDKSLDNPKIPKLIPPPSLHEIPQTILPFQTKYATFKAELQKAQSAAEAAHQASVARFSPAAKAADEKLSAVANNPTLSAQQKGQQIYQLMSSLPDNVREEIQREMMGPMGH